jgi:hypothetical protein
MTSNENNPMMESITQQFKMIGNSKNILNLGGPLISEFLVKNNVSFTELKPKFNLTRIDYFDKLSAEKSWTNELLNLENNFDLIILDDLLEYVKNPELLLENLSNYLSDDGYVVATIKNFFYSENIYKILSGIMPQISLNSYDLDNLNLFLNQSNFIIFELIRNQSIFNFSSNSNLNIFNFPNPIIESLKKNPEFEVTSYTIKIRKNLSTDIQAKKWIFDFPKNYFLDDLKNKFNYYSSIETAIPDKDNVISGLENSLKETKSYYENYIKVKDKIIDELEIPNNKKLLSIIKIIVDIALIFRKVCNLFKKI